MEPLWPLLGTYGPLWISKIVDAKEATGLPKLSIIDAFGYPFWMIFDTFENYLGFYCYAGMDPRMQLLHFKSMHFVPM